MNLKIYLDIVYDDNFDIKKSKVLDIELPNNDLFYVFEAWVNLIKTESGDFQSLIDKCMDLVYTIVENSVSETLGLRESDFLNGRVEIDDPTVYDENNASAVTTIYVKRKK